MRNRKQKFVLIVLFPIIIKSRQNKYKCKSYFFLFSKNIDQYTLSSQDTNVYEIEIFGTKQIRLKVRIVHS